MRGEVRAGKREGVGRRRRNRRARGGPDLRPWGEGTRGAHVEHAPHVRDLGRVEAERLVEHRRGLPSRKAGSIRCGKRCGPGGVRVLSGDEASGMHGEGPTQGFGGRGTRGAHPEHAVHVRDTGRVEAERLVERGRGLPSRKAGVRRGKRCGPGGVRAVGGGDACGMHGEGSTQGWGGAGHARSALRTCRSCP